MILLCDINENKSSLVGKKHIAILNILPNLDDL